MHGYEGIALGFDAFPKIISQASLDFSFKRYREQDLKSPFISDKTSFPIGVDQRDASIKSSSLFICHLNGSIYLQKTSCHS